MAVPLLDLQPQLAPLREEILAAVTEVIDSCGYIMGPKVESLERAVADYCGVEHAIGVASGTDALLVALMALDIGPGDLVLTTPYSFFATMGSILRLGARPLFVDIDPVTFNIDPLAARELLESRPELAARVKAIIPVHLYGQCAEMAPLLELAQRFGLAVVEDAAQAIGALYPPARAADKAGWRRAGSMGDAGCFSFFPSKNLGGIGDGGMVICRDAALAEKIRILRVHGSAPKYHHGLVGGNFRLDPIQAVVLEIKLGHLPAWHAARRNNAEGYRRLFADSGLLEDGSVLLPAAVYREQAQAAGIDDYHIYNQFVPRFARRDQLLAHLRRVEIGCEVYYPVPLHKQGCVAELGYHEQVFPEAERAAGETLALPIYPELTEEMQREVVAAISSFYRGERRGG
ncbi:DegT/DnrJ/EryC1/StrS family aminotransferase [Desulfurivibrio sp. D14AmB]|uniref:DegT/DnrJ/EryC1/StrS family aminotransferase n=1 Tax=Desulfurivibrio sp. D14AmB TaxID=3374370 RepID=UPI00376EC7F7